MASVQTQHSLGHGTTFEPLITEHEALKIKQEKHDVHTSLNYYLDDGNPPRPTYVGKPETYERTPDPLSVTVHDIRGEENHFNLDKQGFLIYPHISKEKDFIDEEKIKAEYYPEVEQLLKEA